LKQRKEQELLVLLTLQLEEFKDRAHRPGADRWRQMGKLAQDFSVWLERARPWLSCASSLISLRVEQIMVEVEPHGPPGKALQKLSDLLSEAGRHLANPGSPIQVIDLEREGKDLSVEDPWEGPAAAAFAIHGPALPSEMVTIPSLLYPEKNPAIPFCYIIPN
jgi:hypothetical protein